MLSLNGDSYFRGISAAIVCLSGYAQAVPAQAGRVSDFNSLFQLADTIVPSGQDSVPLVRVSGVYWARNGRIVIADVSEANVKIYGPTGRLIRVVGRKGQGPGEFQEPRYPLLNEGTGELIVGEANGFISIFDSLGRITNKFRLSVSGISSLNRSPSGNYLVTGWPAAKGVVIEFDANGTERHRYLKRTEPPAPAQRNDPRWNSVTQYWSVLLGEKAYVASTVSDSLWVLDLSSSKGESQVRVPLSGYSPPQLPGMEEMKKARDPFAWIRQYHTAVGLLCDTDSGRVGISFVKGILNYGDPASFLFLDRSGKWTQADRAPPVIAMRGTRLLVINRPQSEVISLAVYKPRRGT